MAFENMIHGGGAPTLTESVYFTGTDTLLEGYALCYDFNAADVNQENAAQTAGTSDGVIIPDVGEEHFNSARRLLVEKPTEGNKIHFAGVVSKESDGMTGPGWVKIHKPGSICNIYAYSNADHETSTAGNASGQIMNLVVDQYYFMDGGFPGKGAGIVLQDVDRSSTAGLVMAELMTGIPSGGINRGSIVSTHAGGSAPALSDVVNGDVMYCGAYILREHTLGSTLISSKGPLAADGRFIGQKFGFFNSTFVSTAVSLHTSTTKAAMNTLSVIFNISAAGDYHTCEWSGHSWVILNSVDSTASI